MTNYMGKSRLKRILLYYLRKTSMQKYNALKDKIKRAKEEGGADALDRALYYSFYRGTERFHTNIVINGNAYAFKIYSTCDKKGNRRVELAETKFGDEDCIEVFSGYALFDERFFPVKNEGNHELQCVTIFKSNKWVGNNQKHNKQGVNND